MLHEVTEAYEGSKISQSIMWGVAANTLKKRLNAELIQSDFDALKSDPENEWHIRLLMNAYSPVSFGGEVDNSYYPSIRSLETVDH